MYIPTVYVKDGECQVWLYSPIEENLQNGFWRAIDKLPLMDDIEKRWWSWPLRTLCNFSEENKAPYQEEIRLILNGYSKGEVW